MLDVFGVARDCVEPLLACQEREGEDAGLVCGRTGSSGSAKEVRGDPVMDTVPIQEEDWEAPHEGVCSWTREGSSEEVEPEEVCEE